MKTGLLADPITLDAPTPETKLSLALTNQSPEAQRITDSLIEEEEPSSSQF